MNYSNEEEITWPKIDSVIYPSIQDELWLKNKCYTASGSYLQPFSPNANWRLAKIFVVGFNPISSFRDEFESYDTYWEALTQFPASYDEASLAKYTKREFERSRTSKRIRELIQLIEPENVLVTNVFAYPTTVPSSIPKSFRQEPLADRIISRLIFMCKPRVLFLHGTEAINFANSYFHLKLNPHLPPEEQSFTGRIEGADIHSRLFAYHHLVGRVETGDVVSNKLRRFAGQILASLSNLQPTACLTAPESCSKAPLLQPHT